MQLVHLHPDLEKQRSLQRKLTEWWSQLNAKASSKRLGSLQSPPHWDSYDELPKSEVTSPKIFHAVSSFTSRFQETKVIAKEAHWMMIATKRKSIPWKGFVPTKSTALAHMMSFQNQKWHLARFLVGKEEMVWYRIWIMQPTARLSPQESVLFRATIGHKFPAIDPGRCFQLAIWLVTSLECPCTNPSTPCSYCGRSFSWIPTVAHSRIVYHVDIAIYMPWRLEVALANRQDKVKGHHRSIILWHEPNCLCTPQFLRLPFTCNLHRFQDTKATTH